MWPLQAVIQSFPKLWSEPIPGVMQTCCLNSLPLLRECSLRKASLKLKAQPQASVSGPDPVAHHHGFSLILSLCPQPSSPRPNRQPRAASSRCFPHYRPLTIRTTVVLTYLTVITLAIMLGSHLLGHKGRGWWRWRGGGGLVAMETCARGLTEHARFVLWGLQLPAPPSNPPVLGVIQYRNCKFYIKRVKSQMHMSQWCHKVNLLSWTKRGLNFLVPRGSEIKAINFKTTPNLWYVDTFSEHTWSNLFY